MGFEREELGQRISQADGLRNGKEQPGRELREMADVTPADTAGDEERRSGQLRCWQDLRRWTEMERGKP